jgi:hypothetical protein
MAARMVRLALRLLPGQAACMVASCCSRVTWRFVPSHAWVAMLARCVWAHALVRAELVVRSEDLSCEAETSCAKRRLVVRGGDEFLLWETGRRCDQLAKDWASCQ